MDFTEDAATSCEQEEAGYHPPDDAGIVYHHLRTRHREASEVEAYYVHTPSDSTDIARETVTLDEPDGYKAILDSLAVFEAMPRQHPVLHRFPTTDIDFPEEHPCAQVAPTQVAPKPLNTDEPTTCPLEGVSTVQNLPINGANSKRITSKRFCAASSSIKPTCNVPQPDTLISIPPHTQREQTDTGADISQRGTDSSSGGDKHVNGSDEGNISKSSLPWSGSKERLSQLEAAPTRQSLTAGDAHSTKETTSSCRNTHPKGSVCSQVLVLCCDTGLTAAAMSNGELAGYYVASEESFNSATTSHSADKFLKRDADFTRSSVFSSRKDKVPKAESPKSSQRGSFFRFFLSKASRARRDPDRSLDSDIVENIANVIDSDAMGNTCNVTGAIKESLTPEMSRTPPDISRVTEKESARQDSATDQATQMLEYTEAKRRRSTDVQMPTESTGSSITPSCIDKSEMTDDMTSSLALPTQDVKVSEETAKENPTTTSCELDPTTTSCELAPHTDKHQLSKPHTDELSLMMDSRLVNVADEEKSPRPLKPLSSVRFPHHDSYTTSSKRGRSRSLADISPRDASDLSRLLQLRFLSTPEKDHYAKSDKNSVLKSFITRSDKGAITSPSRSSRRVDSKTRSPKPMTLQDQIFSCHDDPSSQSDEDSHVDGDTAECRPFDIDVDQEAVMILPSARLTALPPSSMSRTKKHVAFSERHDSSKRLSMIPEGRNVESNTHLPIMAEDDPREMPTHGDITRSKRYQGVDDRKYGRRSSIADLSTVTVMFGRKGHGDVKKSATKVLDHKKDTVTRLKHLKVVLDTYEVQDAKAFFEQYYSYIYFVFHDVFTNVEADLKQRANKTHREELDFVLFIFEKILTLLPELIHKRWQYHSIGHIMKKLLHSDNSIKLQRDGIRLFIIWYQILMDNAMEDCHMTYRSLVPHLCNGQAKDVDLFSVRDNNSSKVYPMEVTPLLPQMAEKPPDNISKYTLEALLTFMVSEVNKIEWPNKDTHEFSFNFLFNQFKSFYLCQIFPDFKALSIYEPCLDLPESRSDSSDSLANISTLALCQVAVVRWVANFTHMAKDESSSQKEETKLPSTDSVDRDVPPSGPGDPHSASHPSNNNEVHPSIGSNTSTMSSTYTEQGSSTSSLSSEEHAVTEYEIVRKILFTDRSNINIVHEVFRQAYLLPFHQPGAGAMRKVISVYKEWLQECRPVFMEDPDDSVDASHTHESSPTDASSMAGSHKVVHNKAPVKAGLQKVLQVFITNSANIFLMEPSITDLSKLGPGSAIQIMGLEEQVDMCKRVLNLYRSIVMKLTLSPTTWEQLLLVLLRISTGVLGSVLPKYKEKSLAGRLAQPIFQTLIVSWIKANLNVKVSCELWDKLLATLSSLTSWVELIREWARTMDTLTRVLARHVYELDLGDLPLDRLSEQKAAKKRIGSKPMQASPRLGRQRTFSRGWSRHDAVENLRSQLYNMPAVGVHNLLPPSHSSGAPIQQMQRSPRLMRRQADSATVLGRHRSRSGEETSPLHQSTTHLVRSREDLSEMSGSELPLPGVLLRSSSDSSLFIPDNDKTKGMYYSAHEDMDSVGTGSIPMSRSMGAVAAFTHTQDMPIVNLVENSCDEESSLVNHSQPSSTLTGDTVSVASSEVHFGLPPHEASSASLVPLTGDIKSDTSTPPTATTEDTGSINSVSISNGISTSENASQQGEVSADRESQYDDRDRDTDSLIELKKSVFKDSPTPDRESIHLDDVDTAIHTKNDTWVNGMPSQDGTALSVLAGGCILGWTPDVAVLLWRRILGILGDINAIKDPEMHAQVYEYLCDLMVVFIKIRDNLGVTSDKKVSPPPPGFIPPSLLLTSWWFEAQKLGSEYQSGKLLACKLLCMTSVRRQDMELPADHLVRFYRMLHTGLIQDNQETINTLVRHCGAAFFSMPLPGSTLLALDFVHAADTIASSENIKNAPRCEAMCILGSLLCLPNQLGPLPAFQPTIHELTVKNCDHLKDHVITVLLRAGKKEPAGLARCLALCSIGIYLYEELSHDTHHGKVKEAVCILLSSLTHNNKLVAMVACDMLSLLCDHAHILLNKYPDLPRKIIQEFTVTIVTLYPSVKHSTEAVSKKLLIMLMFCLMEWCMCVPLVMLLEYPTHGSKTFLHEVFRVYSMVAQGSLNQGQGNPLHTSPLNTDGDSESSKVHDPSGLPHTPNSLHQLTSLSADLDKEKPTSLSASSTRPRRAESPAVLDSPANLVMKLSANTMISHLVNQLGHFPRGIGASQLNSAVQEHHDLPEFADLDQLGSDIFAAPNVQFFVMNESTLVSYVEVPALTDLPGGGVTGGLTTSKTITRIIVRNNAGIFCWDNSVLYGPPKCRAGSYPAEPQVLLHIFEDIDLLGESSTDMDGSSQSAGMEAELGASSETEETESSIAVVRNAAVNLPKYTHYKQQHDGLNQLLQYIGHTSPECLLWPNDPLNIPSPHPEDLCMKTQQTALDMLCSQGDDESEYHNLHQVDTSIVAPAMLPLDNREPLSPFQLCRLFLNQLGFTHWEKRAQFDQLQKSEKLLREIKHLDSQKCRETHKIAVIYVAEGQEDKLSVLNNTSGSRAYEDFVAGLGWEVDLDTHAGFRGGLQASSCGRSAPYYAQSTREVLFHVATRMPSATDEDRNRKVRHLGNDEVQIIWSEHTRDYRRGIISTEFGDVLIIIYPLKNGLFRIQINRKPEVAFFGPLFDGAILDACVLPGLVRATALNASRTLRTTKPYYMTFYEERARCLDTLIKHHKQPTTFEDFAANVFSPVLPKAVPEFLARAATCRTASPDSSLHSGHFPLFASGDVADGLVGLVKHNSSSSKFPAVGPEKVTSTQVTGSKGVNKVIGEKPYLVWPPAVIGTLRKRSTEL